MQYESERIEYKSQMIDDIYKEVIAFANTDGGVIYLGIDDKGNLIGIENVDETYTRLTNGIRDAIAPDVTTFRSSGATAIRSCAALSSCADNPRANTERTERKRNQSRQATWRN